MPAYQFMVYYHMIEKLRAEDRIYLQNDLDWPNQTKNRRQEIREGLRKLLYNTNNKSVANSTEELARMVGLLRDGNGRNKSQDSS